MGSSPYRPGSGQMPPLIVGRDAQLRRAQAALARLYTDGRPANPLVLTGPRGVGKTVLLRAMQAAARDAGSPAVFLTLDRDSATVARLTSEIGRELHRVLGVDAGARWAGLRDRLSGFAVEVTVPGLKVSRPAAAAPAGPAGPAGLVVDRDELARLVTESADLARTKSHGGLLLILDEVQEARDSDLVVLVNTVQDTVGLGGPVVVVAAGLPQTPDRLMAAGSFAERFTYLPVGKLNPDEALLALVEPARQLGVDWDAAAAEAVLGQAHGSPYLVQLFADAAWEAAGGPDRGTRIGHAAAATGVARARDELHHGMFRGRWAKASPVERELLLAVAATLGRDGTAAVSHVLAVTGRTAGQLSGARQRLLDKGLLEAPARGFLAFTMPGFEDFLRAEHPELAAAPPHRPPLPPPPPAIGPGRGR